MIRRLKRVLEHNCNDPKPSYEQNQAFPLLKLPGEIRNMIYEHALTDYSRSGLYYHGGGLKIAKSSRYPYLKGLTYAWDGDKIAKRKERNLHRTAPALVLINNGVEFNQLKYVSHQVRSETKALELKYNNITFSTCGCATRHPTNTAYTFLEFTRMLEWGSKDDWVKSLTIDLGVQHDFKFNIDPVQSLIRVANWSRQHPAATVRYMFPRKVSIINGIWVKSPLESKIALEDFILRLQRAIRYLRDGPVSDILLPHHTLTTSAALTATRESEEIRVWRNGRQAQEWDAPNFRFWFPELGNRDWIDFFEVKCRLYFPGLPDNAYLSMRARLVDLRQNGI